MSSGILAELSYQVTIEKYIHPIADAAKAFKLHALTVKVEVNDKNLVSDLEFLFLHQIYGLHLYRCPRLAWLPFWKEDRISVMDKDDLKAFTLGTTSDFAFSHKDPGVSEYNIGKFNIFKPSKFKFSTKMELIKMEPLIERAINRFLEEVIFYGTLTRSRQE